MGTLVRTDATRPPNVGTLVRTDATRPTNVGTQVHRRNLPNEHGDAYPTNRGTRAHRRNAPYQHGDACTQPQLKTLKSRAQAARAHTGAP